MNETLTIEKVIPDPPGTVRHGMMFLNSSRKVLVVGRIYHCNAGFFVELVDPWARVTWNYSLDYIDDCIKKKKLTEVEMVKKDGVVF